MGEMAGSLAHELNQPLTGIVNNASAGRRFIAKGRADLPKLDGLFEAIVADGRRAGEIIRGIRGMVRKGKEVRGPVNLNDVIASVLRFVHSDALGHHCALVTEAGPELPLVEGDQVQLQQVLLNLVVNAFEAMRETPAAERRMIIRSERESEGRVRVSVRDFGIGLPAEEPARIFERFFSTKREGMGMGLAIARSIIASHGGELAAANAHGWWRLRAFFAAGHRGGPGRMKRTAAVGERARGMKELEPRVFVVDDDQSVRTSLANLLATEDYAVEVFAQRRRVSGARAAPRPSVPRA